MAKVTLNEIGDLTSTTTAQTALNQNFDAIEVAIEDTLSRTGIQPNAIYNNIDMNGFRLFNLSAPDSNTDPVRVQEFNEAVLGQGLGTALHITNADEATSVDTGSLTTDGGVGINGNLYIGGTLHVGTFTASPTELDFLGATSGQTAVKAQPVASGTITIPSATDTLVGKATTDTLTNKTLTSPVITTPIGLVKGDVGLGNVDNTSDATKNSAVATLTNKTINASSNTLTGTASGLTAGNVTTNANLTGPITSVGNATSVASQTGTGTKFVMDTSPTLVTPNIGVATATSVNKVAITAPATSATLALVDGTTITGPATTDTLLGRGSTDTITGVKTFNSGKLVQAGATSGTTVVQASATASGTLTLPAATDTLVGKATTDTLTNKTIDTAGPNTIKINGNTLSATAGSATVTIPNSTDTLVGKATTDTLTNKTFNTAGTGNVFQINGTGITAVTGTGSAVLATSPTLVTPVLGAATATTINGATIDNNAWSTSWTPTYTTSTVGGTPISATTNSARFQQRGKTVFFSLDFAITGIGVGNSGRVTFTLPATAQSALIMAIGKEVTNTGKMISVSAESTTVGGILFYDASSAIQLNNRFQLGGMYEAA